MDSESYSDMKKFTRVEYFAIESDDLDEIIKENFDVRRDWTIIAIEELSNDSTKEFYVTPEKLNLKWHNLDDMYITANLLDDLCYRELIVPGYYLVNVCW